MNICILSMQKVKNYGSLLQAYSLKKLIESLGHSVSFIDICPSEKDNALRSNVVEFDEGQSKRGRNIISAIKNHDENFYYAVKKCLNKRLIQKKQSNFGVNVLKLDDLNNLKEYDVCVIGSDEVFNCMNNAPWGFTTQLFGNVSQASKVITYAASCGFTNYNMLTKELKVAIIEAFYNVSAFSVRDENTSKFVEELTEKIPEINLDPVVVGNFDEEISKVNLRGKLPKKYCIVYAYPDRVNSLSEILAIKELCKKNKVVPISIGGYQKWIKKHPVLSPIEVLAAFKGAEFVITDTFHGTIFSAKYAKKFGVIVRDSNRNKLGDLISRLEIKEHEISDIKDIENKLNVLPNKEKLDKIIKEERQKSLSYLEKNL